MKKELWDKYKGKHIKLLIEDVPYPKKKDGLCLDYDETHIWLQTDFSDEPIGFLKSSIKRIEIIK
jgi:hypothetical protein